MSPIASVVLLLLDVELELLLSIDPESAESADPPQAARARGTDRAMAVMALRRVRVMAGLLGSVLSYTRDSAPDVLRIGLSCNGFRILHADHSTKTTTECHPVAPRGKGSAFASVCVWPSLSVARTLRV
jgi:hypothetical protein